MILKTFGALLGAALFIWLFSSCSPRTVAPKPVYAGVIAFDKNTQNAGVIDCDENGCVVTPAWIDRYHRMETDYKSTIYEDSMIKSEGSNWRVPLSVQNHYASLRSSERGP